MPKQLIWYSVLKKHAKTNNMLQALYGVWQLTHLQQYVEEEVIITGLLAIYLAQIQ